MLESFCRFCPMVSDKSKTRLYWFLAGMRGLFSLPSLILMTSFVGFSAFALESGIPRSEAVFMTFIVWALPAKMILIGMMTGGASLAACFLTVTLSSVRIMPMVASIVPEMRSKGTPVWLLLLLSHFIAITAWVFASQNIHQVPRPARVAYFAGFGMTLALVNTLIVFLSYGAVSAFPPLVAGVLFFLTPVYFIASIWATARHSVVRIAFVVGIVGGPLFALIEPEFDILYVGIGGGTLAYLFDRYVVRRKRLAAAGEGKA